MTLDYTKWRHIAELDPAEDISEEKIEQIKTDAFMISGTLDVTREKVIELRDKIKTNIPIVLESFTADSVVYDGIDYIFLPFILNSSTREGLMGRYLRWIMDQDFQKIDKNKIITEGYILLNPNDLITKSTDVDTNFSLEDIKNCALTAEYFGIPIIHIGYGDLEAIKAVSEILTKSRLFYSGNISSEKILEYADTIVVGLETII